MQYRTDKQGNRLSVLGFGCMRLPQKGGKIDMEETEKELMTAYSEGINYFDTAYIYGGSEAAIGEIFQKNAIRDKVFIATKLPQYLITSRAGIDKYFNEQLSRLRTDYIDYYLMHHLTDIAMWEKLKKVGIIEWIEEKKKTGAIKNAGFSYHGNSDGFIRILEDYDWDICQVQYNYYDEHTQAGAAGVKAAYAKGVPVIIMEPLRGGKLVNLLPESAKKIMSESGRGWSPAAWSFRWLYDQPEVTVVLSGMNSMQMLEENIKTATDSGIGDLSDGDREVLQKVIEKIREKEKVGCTGCRYCMPCPKGVDIPGIFSAYNIMFTESFNQGRIQHAQTVGLTKEPSFASQCVGCGKCEKHCPQGIEIRRMLKEADKALRPLHYKIGLKIARKFMYRKTK